jgi:hypothetical protein
MTMSTSEISALVDRTEQAIAKIEVVAAAIKKCQAHCWVEASSRGEAKRFAATFLVACAGACFGAMLGR